MPTTRRPEGQQATSQLDASRWNNGFARNGVQRTFRHGETGSVVAPLVSIDEYCQFFWAAPSPCGLGSRAIARPEDGRATEPAGAVSAHPGHARCRKKRRSWIEPCRGSAWPSRKGSTVLGRARRGLEMAQLVLRAAHRPALPWPCAPCCRTPYGRDEKIRSGRTRRWTWAGC